MQQKTIIQGREITAAEIEFIQQLIKDNPSWSQWKLSRAICHQWLWCNDKGQIKDIACRSLLRKLENKGYITLPPRRHKPAPRMKDQAARGEQVQLSFLSDLSEAQTLKEAMPLSITIASPRSADGKLLAALLAKHHYLGYKGSVGENLLYLVRDKDGGILGCVVFGAAAWKVAPRDRYIGWDVAQRQQNLKLAANNMRFLLLHKIPHLASHILGQIAKRISQDWQEKYGHPIIMLETFVEVDRFKGTCYRAANWLYVGETQGRSRNDRYSKLRVPVKHIYLYPLTKRFKEKLCV